MESKTKNIAFTSLFIFFLIDILISDRFGWSPIITPTREIHNIKSVFYMIAESLFIIRGIYYLRSYGIKKQFIFELLLGLFLVISSFSMLYLTKHLGDKFFSNYKLDINATDNPLGQQYIANNIYVIKGESVILNGSAFVPSKDDIKMREQYIEISSSMEIIKQGLYNVTGITLLSILLGLFLSPLTRTRSQ